MKQYPEPLTIDWNGLYEAAWSFTKRWTRLRLRRDWIILRSGGPVFYLKWWWLLFYLKTQGVGLQIIRVATANWVVLKSILKGRHHHLWIHHEQCWQFLWLYPEWLLRIVDEQQSWRLNPFWKFWNCAATMWTCDTIN